jgi:type IV pilus assembly protein PilN
VIRVNLLPEKRAAARRSAAVEGQAWLFVVIGVVLFEILGLTFLQKSKNDELAVVQKKNQEIQANIDEIKKQISNRTEIQAQLKELREREDAIQKLESGRTGPTSVLLELSHLLTPGRLPTVDRDKLEQKRRDDPTAVPSLNWDARRMWLTQYDEVDRRVHLAGLARDGEDVSEFLRRLQLSDYFYDVRMLPASKSYDSAAHVELVKFELSAKVRY